MSKREHIALGFLAFCLTATLFIGTTTSKTNPSIKATQPYDPWMDTNDDGIIDIVDIVNLAIRFGEEGTPIDKACIAYNYTFITTQDWCVVDVWWDMQYTSLTINLIRSSVLLIMFSAEARTDYGDDPILIRAMVDNSVASPMECTFIPAGNHATSYASYAFNFVTLLPASAGKHTVKIQWKIGGLGLDLGNVQDRTLAVLAVNQ